MKKLPVGVQNFEEIIEEGYIYVDKTEYVYKLITEGKVYFLSRPRRFGKSLLLSTIENVFKGRKELFRGLYIYDEIDWNRIQAPVVRIDMVNINKETPERFKQGLIERVQEIAEEYNVTIDSDDYQTGFYKLIKSLGRENRIVLLIDEYDKPIIDFIDKPEVAAANREILKNFYGIIKGTDEYLQFVLLTGVTKFSRTSIFSDLNNLYDLTMDREYSLMLGYTDPELETHFREYMERMCKEMQKQVEELRVEIRRWYNGYRFSEEKDRVYNPFSILNFFRQNKFGNYWFESGTPTFLVKLIKRKGYNLPRLENLVLTEGSFTKYEVEDVSIEALLFQTGYLTIERVEGEGIEREYKLYYPNLEVKVSLLNCLFREYAGRENTEISILAKRLKRQLRAGEVEEFLEEIKSIYAGIPYELIINREDYYNTVMYITLSMVGIEGGFEVMTHRGRLDCALEMGDAVYVFEFKLDRGVEEAIEQIRKKRYYERYKGKVKQIYLVGVRFSSEERNIAEYRVETLNP